MSKTLIVIGLALVAAGLLWPLVSKLDLFRLPGDIAVERENVSFYFPITTMVIVSLVLSLILWFFNR
ncbi:hypothetical protein J2R99_002508 [Rhodopseudomonas julia]|uniref:DUF2905 domain-containing protein n=1 Tax=Rhodopseudomonas julia TaxID=200617 RepID=A0ABU0C7Z4_9BRAD|nr:DUF2905 domain-containing protein [Rhodopseudomonas julia]MDQ0326639.1 hypothetical protein [Rhodopseudomonas julia]